MRTGPAPFPRGPLIAAAVAGGIVTLAGLLAARDKPGELPVYVRASARLLAGGTLYPPGEEPAFSYPPAFALVTAPLVPLPAFGRRWGLVDAEPGPAGRRAVGRAGGGRPGAGRRRDAAEPPAVVGLGGAHRGAGGAVLCFPRCNTSRTTSCCWP